MSRAALRAALALAVLAGCVTPKAFPDAPILWLDRDREPFSPRPEASYSGLGWDAFDQLLLAPLVRLASFDPVVESWNVNALDEVPTSSWFDASRPTSEEFRRSRRERGPCKDELGDGLDWLVTAGKPDGDNPGFLARLPDGRRFLLKFDSLGHARATTADVVASRVLFALGYHVPCNRIVYVDLGRVGLESGARYRTSTGERLPMSREVVLTITRRATRDARGLVRAAASELLPGEPLGPFRYEGVRADDPNDVIPHEHRRELRALRLACAWLGRTDAREANTLDTWVTDDSSGAGHVEHHLLDFGDALGSVWEPPALGRRVGESAYVDVPDMLVDWLTLGLVTRPWESRRFGPFGPPLGYFDVEHFVPERWSAGYDNPAMVRMTERDASWIARRIAELDDTLLEAIVVEARLEDTGLAREYARVLRGRRRMILNRHLGTHVSLGVPEIVPRMDGTERRGEAMLCARVLLESSPTSVPNVWRASNGDGGRPLALTRCASEDEGELCVVLDQRLLASLSRDRRAAIEIARGDGKDGVMRAHLTVATASTPRLVGIERRPRSTRTEIVPWECASFREKLPVCQSEVPYVSVCSKP